MSAHGGRHRPVLPKTGKTRITKLGNISSEPRHVVGLLGVTELRDLLNERTEPVFPGASTVYAPTPSATGSSPLGARSKNLWDDDEGDEDDAMFGDSIDGLLAGAAGDDAPDVE